MQFCGLCSKASYGERFQHGIDVKQEVVKVFSNNLDFDLNMCEPCLQCLTDHSNFIKECLNVERTIVLYLETTDTKGPVHLSNVLQFKSKFEKEQINFNQETGYQSGIDLIGFHNNIKTEIIDEDIENNHRIKNEEKLGDIIDKDLIKPKGSYEGITKFSDSVSFDENHEDIGNSYTIVKSKNRKATAYFNCSICSSNTRFLVTSEEYLKFQCGKCKFNTKCKTCKEAHLARHPNKKIQFQCSDCDYSTTSKNRLRNHVLVHQIPMFNCEICGYKAKLNSILKRHILACHKTPEEVALLEPDRTKVFQCDICSYTSAFRYYLNCHMKVHQNREEWPMIQCEICDYKAKRKSLLKRHMTLHHQRPEEIPSFKCDSCDYKAKEKNILNKHILHHHKNEKDITMFLCTFCGYKAREKKRINQHMVVHETLEETGLFTCDSCDFKSKRKGCLKRHAELHKKVGQVKLYYCDVCLFKTRYPSFLDRHKVTHPPTVVKETLDGPPKHL